MGDDDGNRGHTLCGEPLVMCHEVRIARKHQDEEDEDENGKQDRDPRLFAGHALGWHIRLRDVSGTEGVAALWRIAFAKDFTTEAHREELWRGRVLKSIARELEPAECPSVIGVNGQAAVEAVVS